MFLDHCLKASDLARIEYLLDKTAVFTSVEINTAIELANDRLSGRDTSYQFVLARDVDERLLGFTCYGEIPLTQKRYDLYWIAVAQEQQQIGLGKKLLLETEKSISSAGGKLLYAETSSTSPYKKAQAFYLKCGFTCVAELPDYYRDNDGKLIYEKRL